MLDGDLSQKHQSMAQQPLSQLLLKLIHMVNSLNGSQTQRSKSGKSQLFMSTHTSIHSLVPFIMLMDQELLKMEE
jgi:hypothetical protein